MSLPRYPRSQVPPFAPPSGLDAFELRERLHLMFSEHGQVQRLELLRADQAGQRRFLRFVRMRSESENQAVARALGLGRFGVDLVMLLAPDQDSPINPPWLSSLPSSSAVGTARL